MGEFSMYIELTLQIPDGNEVRSLMNMDTIERVTLPTLDEISEHGKAYTCLENRTDDREFRVSETFEEIKTLLKV